jgi:hypothetical protein
LEKYPSFRHLVNATKEKKKKIGRFTRCPQSQVYRLDRKSKIWSQGKALLG